MVTIDTTAQPAAAGAAGEPAMHDALVELVGVLLEVVSEVEAAGLLSHQQRGRLRDATAAYRTRLGAGE